MPSLEPDDDPIRLPSTAAIGVEYVPIYGPAGPPGEDGAPGEPGPAGPPGSGSAALGLTILSEFRKTGGTKFDLMIPNVQSHTYIEAYGSMWNTFGGFTPWKRWLEIAQSETACNGVKLIGDGLQGQIQYLDRFLQIVDYAADLGHLVYLNGTATQNVPGLTIAQEIEWLGVMLDAIAERVTSGRLQLIGVDLHNELDNARGELKPSASAGTGGYSTIALLEALFGLMADKLPGVPASCSLLVQHLSQMTDNASDDWIPVMKTKAEEAGVPFFIDVHPYAVPANALPFTVAQYRTVSDLRPTVPYFFGETSVLAGLSELEWENNYAEVSDTLAGNPSYTGTAAYPQAAFDTQAGGEPRRLELQRAIATMAKVDGGSYGQSATPLPGAALTGSLVDVAGASFRLKAADATLVRGKVPVWRVRAEAVGDSGDTVTLRVVDGDNAMFGTGSRKSQGSALLEGLSGGGGFIDSSSHARTVAKAGTITVTTSDGGRYDEGAVLGTGRLLVDPWTIPRIFRMGGWFKRTAGGTGEVTLLGRWVEGGSTSDGTVVTKMFVNRATGQLTWYLIGSSAEFVGDASVTLPADGAYHWVEVGTRSNGLMISAVDGFAGSNGNFAPAAIRAGSPSVPFSVGDSAAGGAAFVGLGDVFSFRSSAMPDTDYAAAVQSWTTAPVSDGSYEMLLQADVDVAGTGGGSGFVATPFMPPTVSASEAQVQASSSGGDGTLRNVVVEWQYR